MALFAFPLLAFPGLVTVGLKFVSPRRMCGRFVDAGSRCCEARRLYEGRLPVTGLSGTTIGPVAEPPAAAIAAAMLDSFGRLPG